MKGLAMSGGNEDAELIAPGVWRVRTWMPGHSFGALNSYLLQAKDGLVLIDTPWGQATMIADLECGIRRTGHSPADVRAVLVTHYHEDHSGSAGWFQGTYGATVGMHPLDALNRWRRFGPGDFVHVLDEWADETGVDDGSREFAFRQYRELTDYGRPVVVDRPLSDASTLSDLRDGLCVVHTPGHTSGSVSFFDSQTRILFSGDHVFDRRRANAVARPYSSRRPIGEYWESMQKLLELNPALVLPAHGGPIADLTARAEQLWEIRNIKLGEVVSLADGGTAWQIAQRVSRRSPWDALDGNAKLAATGETLAYLYEACDEELVIAHEERPVRWTASSTDTEWVVDSEQPVL